MNTTEQERAAVKPRKRKRPQVDGLRLFAEFWVLVCQLVSLTTLYFSTTVPDGLSWTLLSLCITTITTFLQFRKELGEYGQRVPLLSLPAAAFAIISLVLGLACLVDELKPYVETRGLGLFVCGVLVLRQIWHILSLVSFYERG